VIVIGFDNISLCIGARQDNHRYPEEFRGGLDYPENFKPVNPWQPEIEKDKVWPGILYRILVYTREKR
jgi:hypothetical protein